MARITDMTREEFMQHMFRENRVAAPRPSEATERALEDLEASRLAYERAAQRGMSHDPKTLFGCDIADVDDGRLGPPTRESGYIPVEDLCEDDLPAEWKDDPDERMDKICDFMPGPEDDEESLPMTDLQELTERFDGVGLGRRICFVNLPKHWETYGDIEPPAERPPRIKMARGGGAYKRRSESRSHSRRKMRRLAT
jgi:hypothetical protein